MSKNSRGFVHLILIIGIVLVGIVGIGYFAIKSGQIKISPQRDASTPPTTPTPSTNEIDTSNQVPNGNLTSWKTYRNEEYGFEFRYPPDILIPSDCLDGVNLYPADSKMPWSQYCNSPLITLVYSTGELSTEQLGQSNFEVTIEKMTVAGQRAVKRTTKKINKEVPGQDLTIDVQFKNDKYFMFTLKQQHLEDEFSQILSTFKFLSNVSEFSIRSKANSPDNVWEIAIKTRGEADSFEKQFTITNLDTNTEKVLLSNKGVGSSNWTDVVNDNWSPDSKHYYLLEHIPDRGELYVFKTSGRVFPNNKEYLKASLFGYDNRNTLSSARWISNNQIEITTANAVSITNYVFDIENETIYEK